MHYATLNDARWLFGAASAMLYTHHPKPEASLSPSGHHGRCGQHPVIDLYRASLTFAGYNNEHCMVCSRNERTLSPQDALHLCSASNDMVCDRLC